MWMKKLFINLFRKKEYIILICGIVFLLFQVFSFSKSSDFSALLCDYSRSKVYSHFRFRVPVHFSCEKIVSFEERKYLVFVSLWISGRSQDVNQMNFLCRIDFTRFFQTASCDLLQGQSME